MTDPHPSYLVLDRHAVGAPVEPAVVAHVAECPVCREYVTALQVESPLPAWLRGVPSQAIAPMHDAGTPKVVALRRFRVVAASTGAVLALAAAALVALLPQGSVGDVGDVGDVDDGPAPLPGFTTVRGEPSVGVYVRRDGAVQLWNGADALRPGDKLRLKVVPDGYREVRVVSLDAAGRDVELYRGAIPPNAATTLPGAWALDDQPGTERIDVILSSPVAGEDQGSRGSTPKGTHRIQLRIPKQAP